MGIFSRVESRMEDTFEGAADKMFDAPISPVQIAKKAEKQMRREKMVGAGKQYAPTLYTVLVNPDDDRRLFGYYPTLAGETETYLAAKASEQGLMMDGQPLVRFIVDDGLRHGKFDVIAEAVAAPIISQLRDEEMQRYGLADNYRADVAYPAERFGHNSAEVPPKPRSQNSLRHEDFDNYGQQGYNNYAQQQAYQNNAWDQPQQSYDGYDQVQPQGYGQAQPAYDMYDQAQQAQAQQGYDIYDRAQQAPASNFDVPSVGAPAAAPAAAAGAAAAGYAAGQGFGAGQAQAQAPAQQRAPQTMVFNGGSQAAAAGQQPASARLIDTTANRTYTLNAGRNTIGRESRNDVSVPDINASRTHAEITLNGQGMWVVTDLGSTNGTYVNGRAIASQPLNNGDHISIGTTDLVFTLA